MQQGSTMGHVAWRCLSIETTLTNRYVFRLFGCNRRNVTCAKWAHFPSVLRQRCYANWKSFRCICCFPLFVSLHVCNDVRDAVSCSLIFASNLETQMQWVRSLDFAFMSIPCCRNLPPFLNLMMFPSRFTRCLVLPSAFQFGGETEHRQCWRTVVWVVWLDME